jgi:F-type H+-transporting ATPase subunit a
MSLSKLLFLVLSVCFVANVSASANSSSDKEFDVSEMIMHHVKDAHEWHLWGTGKDAVSIYLPVILIDNGIQLFSSSELYHGKETNVKDHSGKEHHYLKGFNSAEGYAMYHEKIYKLNSEGNLEFHDGHPKNVKPLDFSVTKNVTSLIIGALLILLLMLSMSSFYKKNGAVAPKGVAKFLEPFIVVIRDDIAKENIGEQKYHKYVPYLLTIFFFIWINNLLGLVPIFPGGANLTGNITITFFLALCTLLITLFSSNKNYWKHIFATPGVPLALMPIMIPIEIVGIFTKPFALMIRLFANITAGHIIILALISIIFINKNMAWGALSVPMALFISVLELLVAVLQAYLFALLSALFIGAAVEEAHH